MCIYIDMHTSIHTYMYTCIHTYKHTYIHTYTHKHLHLHLHEHMHMHMHIRIRIHIHIHIHIHIPTHPGSVGHHHRQLDLRALPRTIHPQLAQGPAELCGEVPSMGCCNCWCLPGKPAADNFGPPCVNNGPLQGMVA